jgi:crotonobetainyl-CoA:carnitine CoA-transferase CaiB-like acyl-CoA transferase
VVDYYAAALLAGAVSSALYERERSGQGQQVGVSLLRSALAMQSARLVWADGEPRAVGRDMRSGGITGIHPTREGHLYISANTPHFWRALCHKVGLPALAEAERYDSVRKRALHKDEIVPLLHQALQQRTALEWEALFGDEVPCAAAREVEDMFDHPQVQHEQMIGELRATRCWAATAASRGPCASAARRGPMPLPRPRWGSTRRRCVMR